LAAQAIRLARSGKRGILGADNLWGFGVRIGSFMHTYSGALLCPIAHIGAGAAAAAPGRFRACTSDEENHRNDGK
jgi:hypothetical protein